jgi:hypothetical protein
MYCALEGKTGIQNFSQETRRKIISEAHAWMQLQETRYEVVDHIQLYQDRVEWHDSVNAVTNH